MSDPMSDERLAELRADLLGFPAYELLDEIDRLRGVRPMSDERRALLVRLIADTGKRHWASQPESDPTGSAELLAELAEELLEDRDYTCIRAIELRRQAEATCERRTAERGVARARVDVLERREIEILADRDEALAQLREMAALVNQRADLEHGEVGL